MDVSILSESDQEIFRTDSERKPSFTQTEQFSIIEDGRVLGRGVIYQSNSKVTQIIAAFVGLLSAFFIVGYAIRKYILIPLEKMSLCARQIAEGDLDIQVTSIPDYRNC